VDVVGEALSVVMIDKLPFAAPDDPVYEARLEAIRSQGGNPFRDEQLPQAVIALKQGVGRLIRSESDRGVLVLCDPRLLNRGYGRVFLDSLPPFRRTAAWPMCRPSLRHNGRPWPMMRLPRPPWRARSRLPVPRSPCSDPIR
jgi:Rad3-related DNA helicase